MSLIQVFCGTLLYADDNEDVIVVDINTKNSFSSVNKADSEISESSILIRSLSTFEDDVIYDVFSKIKHVEGNDFKAYLEIIQNIQPLGTYIEDLILKYDSSINNLTNQIEREIESGIHERENEAFRIGELNSDGTPTEYALGSRKEEIEDFVKGKQDTLKDLLESVDEKFRSIIQQSFDLYLELIADLETRTFSASSADGDLDIIKLSYDGQKGEWYLECSIPRYDHMKSSFKVTYQDLTGEDIVSLAPGKESAYEAYHQVASYHDSRLTLFKNYFTATVNFRVETLAEEGVLIIVLNNYLTVTNSSTGRVIELALISSDKPQRIEFSKFRYKDLLEEYPWLHESKDVSSKQREEIESLERKEMISDVLSKFYLGGSIYGGYEISDFRKVDMEAYTADYYPVVGISLYGRFASDSLELGLTTSGGVTLYDNLHIGFDVLIGGGWRLHKNGVLGINIGYMEDINMPTRDLKIQMFYGANWIDSGKPVSSWAKNGEGIRLYIDLYPKVVFKLALEFNISKTPIALKD